MNIQDSPTGPGTGQRRSTLDSAIKPRPSPAPVTEHEFALAVHQALRDYQRTDLLRSSPLLGTRLLQDALARSPGTPPTQMLREVLRSHSEALGQNPKTDRFQQVLQHTYLMPMRSQQAVADALHLSWSTYRRCLAGAVRMLSAALWETETALQAASGDQSVSRHPLGFWLVTASLVLLAIAVSGSVYWQIHRRRRESLVQNPGPVTLAVLPFMDLDPQSGSRYLSDGITDELITRLGRNPHLRVVAHTSSFSLRNKPLDVRDVGRILGVTHIVEGSLQKAGNILRIHVALVSAVSGYELWSGELDMPQHDIFKTEDSIAESILGHLHVPLEPANSGVAASPRAVNPEARDAYLVGLEYLNNRTDDDINQSIVYFHRAIQADPDYAEPWAGLATAYAILRDYQEDVPPDTHYDDALNAANKAIALDPSLPTVHAVLGLLYEEHWQWHAAELEFKRALQLDPSDATAHQWLGMYYWFTGDMRAALTQLRTARSLDPLSLIINADLGRALCYAGHTKTALTQLRATLVLSPQFALTHAFMVEDYLATDQNQLALEEARATARLAGSPSGSLIIAQLGVTYALTGQAGKAKQALNKLLKRSSRMYISGVALSWLYWNLGDKNRAFMQLRRAVNDHDHLMMTVFGPAGKAERADPRFAQIRTLMNLPVHTASN